MNRSRILWLSLGVNVVLGVLAFRALQPGSASAPAHREIPNQAGAVSNAPLSDAPSANPALAQLALFHWSRLASDNLKTYRDNLRGVGCPEPIVYAILADEIQKLFAERRQALVVSYQNEYWEKAAREGDRPMTELFTESYKALTEEAEKMLEELMGDWLKRFKGEQRIEQRKREWRVRYSWLPTEKRDRLIAMEEAFWRRRLEVEVSTPTGADLDEASLKVIDDEMERMHRQLLTAEEYDEFTLRRSTEARWADQAFAFEPTETEWRAVARLRNDFEKVRKELPQDESEETKATLEKMEQELEGTIAGTLGSDRYAEFKRGVDSAFIETFRVMKRHGLPQEVAIQVFNIRQEAQMHAEEVQKLAPEERETLLRAIRQETENTLANTLSPRVLATYMEYAGGWIKGLDEKTSEADP